jgi:hypothetical protein
MNKDIEQIYSKEFSCMFINVITKGRLLTNKEVSTDW